MTYALIDNATLTAVQRVTGAVAVKTSDTINGDLCALENFLQENLFYDDLLCIPTVGYLSASLAQQEIGRFLMQRYSWQRSHQFNSGLPPAVAEEKLNVVSGIS